MIERSGVYNIIGKTISGVLVKEGPVRPGFGPRSEVYLVFTDNTHFEMWSLGSEIEFAAAVRPGGVDAIRTPMDAKEGRRVIFDSSDAHARWTRK